MKCSKVYVYRPGAKCDPTLLIFEGSGVIVAGISHVDTEGDGDRAMILTLDTPLDIEFPPDQVPT